MTQTNSRTLLHTPFEGNVNIFFLQTEISKKNRNSFNNNTKKRIIQKNSVFEMVVHLHLHCIVRYFWLLGIYSSIKQNLYTKWKHMHQTHKKYMKKEMNETRRIPEWWRNATMAMANMAHAYINGQWCKQSPLNSTAHWGDGQQLIRKLYCKKTTRDRERRVHTQKGKREHM